MCHNLGVFLETERGTEAALGHPRKTEKTNCLLIMFKVNFHSLFSRISRGQNENAPPKPLQAPFPLGYVRIHNPATKTPSHLKMTWAL